MNIWVELMVDFIFYYNEFIVFLVNEYFKFTFINLLISSTITILLVIISLISTDV
jgi:hypothetical protein